jgi:hypothetical protein
MFYLFLIVYLFYLIYLIFFIHIINGVGFVKIKRFGRQFDIISSIYFISNIFYFFLNIIYLSYSILKYLNLEDECKYFSHFLTIILNFIIFVIFLISFLIFLNKIYDSIRKYLIFGDDFDELENKISLENINQEFDDDKGYDKNLDFDFDDSQFIEAKKKIDSYKNNNDYELNEYKF